MKKSIRVKAGLKLRASAKTFEIFAYAGGKLNVDGFDVPIVVELATLEARPGYSVLIDHNAKTDHTLGQVSRVENDGASLTISGNITGDHWPVVSNVIAQSKKGHKWEASIGATFDRSEATFVDSGETMDVNGQTLEGPFILARNALLRETSILPMGADPTTQVTLAAKAKLLKGSDSMEPTFEAFCAEMGVDPEGASEPLMALLKAEYDKDSEVEAEGEASEEPVVAKATADGEEEETVSAEGDTDTATDEEKTEAAAKVTLKASPKVPAHIAKRRAEEAAEESRIATIRAKCKGNPAVIRAAIAKGWTPEKAELEMYKRNDRSRAPAGHVKSREGSCTLQALQGAMILRAGGTLDNKAYNGQLALAMGVPSWLRAGLNDSQRNQIMEHAWNYRDMSMVDLAREAIRIDGRQVPHSRQEMIQAAISGSSLTNIFTTNVNTQILAAYDEEGDSTLGWTQETDVADFKTNERPRMTKGPDLAKLPRGKTAEHLDRSDVGESFKIARYAKQFVIDEQDIIDDSFNALADTPKEMGFAAARLRPDLVYSILAANPTLASTSLALFENATQNNLTGSAALGSTTLTAAVSRMRLVQENGVNLNIQPTHLLVPPALEDSSYALLQSQAIVLAGVTDVEKPALNPHTRRSLQLVSDARLQNGVTDPDSGTVHTGSSSTWYLVSAKAHGILVAYLRGTGRAPQTRKFILDKGTWGIGWDINMDIGAKPMDWRGLQKQQSAAL